ncbi:MAG: hypothetical protein U0359_13650 [Byssovorax sp.]
MRARTSVPVVLSLCLAVMGACTAGSTTPQSGATGTGGSTASSTTASSGQGGSTTSASSGDGGDISVGAGTGGSTGSSGQGGGCEAFSQVATNKPRPVDIIWAIDTSDSMVNELQAVEDNMNVFAGAILNQGIDVHVVLIAKPGNPDDGSIFNPDPGICIGPPLATGSCPGGSKPPSYQHVEVAVNSNNALNRLLENYPAYKGTLRKDSIKYFSVVTDDDATDGPNNSAQAFINNVDAIDPAYFEAWKFFGVFCTGNCGVFLACAATGNVYNQLVALKGGVAGDLCGGNSNGFASVFSALAQTVVQGKELDCAWDIPAPPPGQMFDPGLVNVNFTPSNGMPSPIFHVKTPGDCGPQGGWYYDDNTSPTKVQVCPSTCAVIKGDFGAKIDILFGCVTVDVPS